ncbi:MAG: hypothetical protein GY861_15380, partial [bacterium]|nr:hypothetical protein [bacterium]
MGKLAKLAIAGSLHTGVPLRWVSKQLFNKALYAGKIPGAGKAAKAVRDILDVGRTGEDAYQWLIPAADPGNPNIRETARWFKKNLGLDVRPAKNPEFGRNTLGMAYDASRGGGGGLVALRKELYGPRGYRNYGPDPTTMHEFTHIIARDVKDLTSFNVDKLIHNEKVVKIMKEGAPETALARILDKSTDTSPALKQAAQNDESLIKSFSELSEGIREYGVDVTDWPVGKYERIRYRLEYLTEGFMEESGEMLARAGGYLWGSRGAEKAAVGTVWRKKLEKNLKESWKDFSYKTALDRKGFTKTSYGVLESEKPYMQRLYDYAKGKYGKVDPSLEEFGKAKLKEKLPFSKMTVINEPQKVMDFLKPMEKKWTPASKYSKAKFEMLVAKQKVRSLKETYGYYKEMHVVMDSKLMKKWKPTIAKYEKEADDAYVRYLDDLAKDLERV